ncbi:hypothetical protein LINGRAHAP2_LOCUS1789 [Linum grandiflorum]
MYGILRSYTFWFHHGERLDESTSEADENIVESELHQLLSDLYPNITSNYEAATDLDDNMFDSEANPEAKRFYKLIDKSKTPVYHGCKISMLSLLVKLIHIKTLGNWSNESFTTLLRLLKEDILPPNSRLPDSYYEAKKITADLGLTTQKLMLVRIVVYCIGKTMNKKTSVVFVKHQDGRLISIMER